MKNFAILVVNGGPDPGEGRWIELCLDRIAAHTADRDHHVFVWNNNTDDGAVAEIVHARANATYRAPPPDGELTHLHGDPLQRLFEEARDRGFDGIVTIDSDAFPLEPGWLSELEAALDEGAAVAGVWSDEQPEAPPFVHPSLMAAAADWIREQGLRFDEFPEVRPGIRDTVMHFTARALAESRRIFGLPRSNGNSYHRIMGAVYGDRVYHHHAGSRPLVRFRYETAQGQSVPEVLEANARLRDLATGLVFGHRERYLAWLRGRAAFDRPGEPAADLGLVAYRPGDADAAARRIEKAARDPDTTRQPVPDGVDLAPPRTRRRQVAVTKDPAAANVVCWSAPRDADPEWEEWHRARLEEGRERPLVFVETDGPAEDLLVPLGLRPRGRRAASPARPGGGAIVEALRAAAGGEEAAAFPARIRRLLEQRAECDRLKRKRPIRRFLERVPIARGILWRGGRLLRRLSGRG